MKETGNPNKETVGVGMPAALYLHEFGSQCWFAFGSIAYHVGSSLTGRTWRDVDVRVILSDEEYESMGLGNPEDSHLNGTWVALCLAFSALGEKMTGLPIDFQLQQMTHANAKNVGQRSAIGLTPLRMRKSSVW